MQRSSIYLLLISVVGLLALGVVMLFSTSAYAQESHGDIYYFVKKDIFWLIIGMGVCVLGAMTDYHLWQRTWKIWFGVSVVLLALCFVPHVGMKINGSHRWLNLHVLVFQPSELGKIAAVFFVAWWFSREETTRKFPLRLSSPLPLIWSVSIPSGGSIITRCIEIRVPLCLFTIGGILTA